MIDVGNQASPQMVFFGVEYQARDLSSFVIPIEVLCGYFFLVIALAMVGPGQQLGRALARCPTGWRPTRIDILGSLAGIVAVCGVLVPRAVAGLVVRLGAGRASSISCARGSWSWLLALSPRRRRPSWCCRAAPWFDRLRARCGRRITASTISRDQGLINVNLIGHQQMQPRSAPFPAYALPHLLNRDAGGNPFGDVLIIGAGSGNDVSRALAWGAEHVDAVEIDPVIQRIGKQDHPDRPYDDPRVTVHLNDGRNFLKSTTGNTT